jgi:hypothetical protein
VPIRTNKKLLSFFCISKESILPAIKLLWTLTEWDFPLNFLLHMYVELYDGQLTGMRNLLQYKLCEEFAKGDM